MTQAMKDKILVILKWLGTVITAAAAAVGAMHVAGCASPNAEFVKAMRQTHSVVAPAHRQYVATDTGLDAEAKQRRFDLLDAWGMAIKEAEGK
jgi:hypothetical protein